MSPISKSLEHRIQELKTSIDAQQTELSAYEKVLELELAKGNVLPETKQVKPVESAQPSAGIAELQVTGSKTDFITAILRAKGAEGATPKEIDDIFSARSIERSKNLIYNALSFLVKQKRLTRRDGRYYALSSGAPQKSAAVTKGTKGTKRRISPEGLRNIIEATKRRWAAKRAAQEDGTASAKKLRRGKKAAR
jgi:hypothetical protein